ncbi:MAG: galactosyldiacylglycerol synthase [Sporolactobacillus sp.]|nr:galactosyldiacylglycerol synthase [Sporolactobacillus sp.]
MNRILFLSSEHTGNGHKSIIEALSKQLLLLSPNIRFTVIDGFGLGHRFLRLSSLSYDSFAVKCPALWGFIYRLSNPFKTIVNQAVAQNIKKSLLKEIDAFHPDLIVSVHSLFVGSVINILDRAGLDIPLISLIADLDNVTTLWAHRRAKYIICPSAEAKQTMVKAGMTSNQLVLTGFPVRYEFCDLNLPRLPRQANGTQKYRSILLMNGSQGSTQVLKTAKLLLNHDNVRLTIIAGHNGALKKHLEHSLAREIGKRVAIYGFIANVKAQMIKADLLILRASPNVVMEAVNLCKPFIVTGALRGQEEKNPHFILKHHLGLYCQDLRNLPAMISTLLENNGEKLRQISKNQALFRKPESARVIAQLLIKTVKETNTAKDQPIA